MRAKDAVDVPMFAFAEQVDVEVRQLRREGVRVYMAVALPLFILPEQPVMLRHRFVMPHHAFEQVRPRQPFHLGTAFADTHRFRLRHHHPDQIAGVDAVSAENGEGVMMARLNDALEFRVRFRAEFALLRCLLRFDQVHFV